MKAFILAVVIAFLLVFYTASSWASSCACASGTAGDGISCSGGCGCITAGDFCGCWCEHPKAVPPPISFVNRDSANELSPQSASPVARALSKATAECASRISRAISIDVKQATAEAVDIYLQALCERLQRGAK